MSSCTQALSWNIMCDYNPPYVKYEKKFPKMLRDVGMAVLKPQQLGVGMAACRQDIIQGLHK